MHFRSPRFLILFSTAFAIGSLARGAAIQNRDYTLELQPDHSVELRVAGLPAQRLAAEFTVMYSERDTGFGINRVGPFNLAQPRPFPAFPLIAQRWAFYTNDAATPAREIEAFDVKSDVTLSVNSLGVRSLHFTDASGRPAVKAETIALRGTADPFLAGSKNVLHAASSTLQGDTVKWRFPDQPDFSIEAEVVLPQSESDPQIRYHLHVRKAGFYSVAFTGTPWTESKHLVSIPQETIGTGHGAVGYMMSEAHVTLPRVQLATSTMSTALVVDPAESPFRLLEDSKAVWTYSLTAESNSRFGLMTEAKDESLRPLVFSPIMGGYQSRMNANDDYHFVLHYVIHPGSWEETYKHIAKDIYQFRDLRDNSGPGPLYHTLENLMDFLSDRDGPNYSMWHAEQKYYNYWSDQQGIFKPFSPLFGLSAAIVTDDEAFYRDRALPMVEFALSRRSNVFAPYDVQATGMVTTIAAPLGGSYLDRGQLVSLAGMFQGRTYAFPYYAERKEPGKNALLDALAQYRLTGRKEFLAEAEKKADASHGSFMDLLEMYEETGLEKYLKAAVTAAYRYVPIQNLFPVVPDKNVTVEQGNVVPVHGHAYQRHEDWGFAAPPPLPGTQQTVPAWRVSLIGTELSAYRGGYWINNHAQLMRLATYVKDDFLRDLQRAAMVGRYANYAGDFRSNRDSLVAERADAPMHYIYETNFSTFNPGHGCEWVGAVIDFIVSDLFNRSDRQIDFPSRCMYDAGFRTKVYGDRPGRFYDEQNVQLWLPRHLLEADNKQVDYAAGHGNGKFYVAFWNQSSRSEKVRVALNPDLVKLTGSHRARLWINNEDKGTVQIVDNHLNFEAPAKGIVAYAIEGAGVMLHLQAKMAAADAVTLGAKSLSTTEAPFGHVTAMLLSMGKGLTSSFVYTDAPASNVISATLRYRQGSGPWLEKHDAIYPYEFSTEIEEGEGPLECVLEVETADQKVQQSKTVTLGW